MIVDIKHKKQGDNTDSWIVSTWSGDKKGEGELLKRDLVYIDPNDPPLFTDDEIAFIKMKLNL